MLKFEGDVALLVIQPCILNCNGHWSAKLELKQKFTRNHKILLSDIAVILESWIFCQSADFGIKDKFSSYAILPGPENINKGNFSNMI